LAALSWRSQVTECFPFARPGNLTQILHPGPDGSTDNGRSGSHDGSATFHSRWRHAWALHASGLHAPGPGSCCGSYHTDQHPGSWQATVKCPQMARSGCSVWAPAQWHCSQDTSTSSGPHSCPFPHRSG
jgi:hypothetical protein